MILVESIPASILHRTPVCSGLQSFSSDVLDEGLSALLPTMTVWSHQSPAATWGEAPVRVQVKTHTHTRVCATQSIYEKTAAVSKTMIDETDLVVIEHVCSDAAAFKLGCACKCFPLIGSQKRFITRGEYRSATQATEEKFNSDLMSCRLEM